MEMASGSQLVCATNLVVSIARFHRTLKAGLLTPADSGGLAHRDGTGFVSGSRPKSYLMCMSQLNHLFGTCRIPHESRDERQTILGTRHFVVLHKGYTYTCNLFDYLGYILPASTIMDLKEDIKQNLFGSGGDRWFDKSVQFIVGKDGFSGIQMEHSWCDGMMAMYLINMITKDIQNRPAVTHENSVMYQEPSTGVQRLQFDLDGSLETAVVSAKYNLQTLAASTSFCHLEFQHFGSNFLKSRQYLPIDLPFCTTSTFNQHANPCTDFKGCGVSPDSIVQLALQLAFTRMYGHHAMTSEPCSTGTFLHGRTETIQPATIEALECCKVFCADSPRYGSQRTTLLRRLIEATSKQHKQLISEAAMGQGFEQHLFALYRLALRDNQQNLSDLPEFFLDPAYQLQYVEDIFSSHVPNIQAGLFLPIVPEGLISVYCIRDTSVSCYLCTLSTSRDLEAYSKTLEMSLKEIGDVLAGKHQKQMY
uniref:carnitine O-palmitoyltransferase 2, mitochondrial-like isoform X4 n=1 Tax=Myxine glutinosa TaxID=7769 RepID=UPI00358F8E72